MKIYVASLTKTTNEHDGDSFINESGRKLQINKKQTTKIKKKWSTGKLTYSVCSFCLGRTW